MTRILGQISFVVGFCGFLLECVSFGIKVWQTASGNSSMGLFDICEEGICRKRNVPLPVFCVEFRCVAMIVSHQIVTVSHCIQCWLLCLFPIAAVTHDGLSDMQWSSLWTSRIVLGVSMLCAGYGLLVCGKVMQLEAKRPTVVRGIRAFLVAGPSAFPQGRRRRVSVSHASGLVPSFPSAVLSALVMAVYMAKLTLPNKTQQWGAGMVFVILSWILFYPGAAGFLKLVLGSKGFAVEQITYKDSAVSGT
jgi:hypothetical protein